MDLLTRDTQSWIRPGAGVDTSPPPPPTSMQIFIVASVTLSIYSAIELCLMVLLTFKHYRGIYFYSLLVSGFAIVLYSLGFLLYNLQIVTSDVGRMLAITLITLGWYPMVTGQSVVLWSRLHLIVFGSSGERIIRWTGWMIVIDALLFHIPTTVFTFGSGGNISPEIFAAGYNVMEKIQMAAFVCQEGVLSTVYILETSRMLRTSLQPEARRTIKQLMMVNAFIIAMDLALLGMEAAGLYVLETTLKAIVYAIKLKLELAILSKLVRFVGGGGDKSLSRGIDPTWTGRGRTGSDQESQRGFAAEEDISDFVDMSRVSGSISDPLTATSPHSRKNRAGSVDFDDLAVFEHCENATSIRV